MLLEFEPKLINKNMSVASAVDCYLQTNTHRPRTNHNKFKKTGTSKLDYESIMSLCLSVFPKSQRDVFGFNIIGFAVSLQFNAWITAITYDSTLPAKQIYLLSY